MNINGIHLIDNFYRHYCNGQWEHDYGITIQTCDNPGWLLTFSDSKLNEIWNESTCGVIIKRISDKHNVIVTYKNERHTSFQEINIFSVSLILFNDFSKGSNASFFILMTAFFCSNACFIS